ncbi:uncharacterized protein LOC114350182 [Ostrinia furnacalis]|uniref:uncharacterized protein LOC114350182 n=1 Tax=Ostrinia furnacalis TaxID=93504 RepID=UPI00103FA661|nr:uncharacterized protein LOC114350182 [Ostrinia furnacalis]
MKRGQGSTKKGQSGRIPTSKPFCDCRHCECRNCPDVLQKLAITIKDSKSGGIRGKGAKRKKCSKSLKRVSQTSEQRPSILDMLNPNRNCDCEIMARAIRSHIHMNMGMTDQRGGNSEQRPSNSKDIE